MAPAWGLWQGFSRDGVRAPQAFRCCRPRSSSVLSARCPNHPELVSAVEGGSTEPRLVIRLCMQVHAARGRAPFRGIAHPSGSCRRQGGQGAAPPLERHPTPPTVATRLFFAQLYSVLEELREELPAWAVRRRSTRRDTAFTHEVSAKGREAVAAMIHVSKHENVAEDGAQCLIVPGGSAFLKSVYHGATLYHRRPCKQGPFHVQNLFREVHSACVIHQPSAVELLEDEKSAAKEALRREFRQHAHYNVDGLDKVEELYRVTIPRDILLPNEDEVSRQDDDDIYVNAILLYAPSAAYLSFLLPLNRGQIPQCARVARQMERAKTSLSCQAIALLARIASVSSPLSRFSDGSFTVTENGVLYMTPHPNPRRSGIFADTSVYGRSMPCNLAIEQKFFGESSERANVIDLAVLLHNIWCPIGGELLDFEPDPELSVPRLTDSAQCYSLLPTPIRNIIAALVNGDENMGSIQHSRMYKDLQARLDTDAAAT